LAVLARSMKEGQYYMTPLYLVSLPLILVTLMPEISLNLFYALIPITGPSLLLKALILGEYGTARTYFLPVILPTLVYGWISLRWAVDLFRREDVIFRESEVFDLRLWLRNLVRFKEPTPAAGSAVFCFAAMLSLAWFSIQAFGASASPLTSMVLGHLAFIFGPPVALTLLLTSDWKRTLRLRMPRLRDVGLAAGLALTLNPLVRELGRYVEQLFPASELVRSQLAEMAKQVPNLWVALAVFALVPAITEEVAFRGFILSGLRRTYPARAAVILSAFLFGFLHVLLSLFQQLFGATLLGLVLGAIALRTGSLWPGVVFHFVNNALGLLTLEGANHPALGRVSALLFRDPAEGLYRPAVLVPAAILSALMLVGLARGGRVRESDTDAVEG